MTGEQAGRGAGVLDSQRRLARLELAQTWPSYVFGVLVAGLCGLVAGSLLWAGTGPVGGDGPPVGLLTDGLFLLVLANIGINWTSSQWMFVHRDPFTPRVAFLRTLPIPVRDLISSRALLVVANTAATSVAFFAPPYALFPAVRDGIPAAQYLWFALFWVGYILFSAGGLLFLEMGVRGAAALAGCVVWVMVLLPIVVLARVRGVSLVGESLGLVGAYGPLVAVPVLVAGGGSLLLWGRLLERRVRTRELAS